jgi:tripartite-type tricarboxylate transporter receptor subunit TctC
LISPTGAGSGPDVVTRIVADRLTQAWGQQAVVSNRPGGGGMIATQAMSSAERDGYTLFMAIASTLTVMPELQAKLPLDLERDLVPIGLLAENPMMIAVHPSIGVNTLAELVERGRSRPADLLIGAARGTIPHMAWELFRHKAGMEATFVPYPSVARAIQDALGGTLNVIVENPAAVAAAYQSGALKPLAVAAARRLPNYPNVPTVAEALPQLGSFEASGWTVLMAPAGTPDLILRKLSDDLQAVLAQADIRQRLEALGSYVRPLSPADTAAFIRSERDLWRPVVRQIGATQ